MVNPTIDQLIIFLRPYKSARRPPSSKKLPDVKLNAAAIQEISPCVIPKSSAVISNPTNTIPVAAACY